jgi:hypothetical protein
VGESGKLVELLFQCKIEREWSPMHSEIIQHQEALCVFFAALFWLQAKMKSSKMFEI